MFAFTSKGCANIVDAAIANARIRYASERLDFHTYFDSLTVPGIQKILRREVSEGPSSETRKDVVLDLFDAQQRAPHEVWELLLVQACEAELVARRLKISSDVDTELDALVLATFVEALREQPSFFDEAQEFRKQVLTRSARALRRAVSARRALAKEQP